MKVAELQKFLLSTGEVMLASGAGKVGEELSELAGALEHYKEHTLLGLRDVLNSAREGGAPAQPRGRRGAAPPDAAKIEAALAQLRQLHSRALDPSLTREAIEGAVRPFEGRMSGAELDELARRFGVNKKQPSKAKTVKAIVDRIAGERGSFDRAHE